MKNNKSTKFTVFVFLSASLNASVGNTGTIISEIYMPPKQYLIVQPNNYEDTGDTEALKFHLQRNGVKILPMPETGSQIFRIETSDNSNDILNLIEQITGNETDIRVVPLKYMINSVQEGIN